MAVFPRTESDVGELAATMMAGLVAHPALYPSISALAVGALSAAKTAFETAKDTQAQAVATAKVATNDKLTAMGALEDEMRKILYLAEHDCIATPSNLDYLGWSDRKSPTALVAPGQPAALTPTYEGPGSLTLAWKRPVSGGAVSSYRIERSDQPEGGGVPGPWTLINTTYDDSTTLDSQPRGVEMQYRLTATNAAGDSMPSNIATVVL